MLSLIFGPTLRERECVSA